LYVGMPVWWQRQYAGVKNGLNNAAIVTMLPNRVNGLVGLACRRPLSGEWYPMWASARMLAWRDMATETIPALFQATAAFAQRRLEQHYTALMHLVDVGATQGGPDDEVENELLDLEIAAGEEALMFVQASEGYYTLQSMTDCQYNAFIASRYTGLAHLESEEHP
jgi:hypothetical protein